MKLSRKKEEAPAPQAPAEPSEEVKLLTEIRDLLKLQAGITDEEESEEDKEKAEE